MNDNNTSPNFKPVIALIAIDVVGPRMAGPGIRYWEFAKILDRDFEVKLIIPPFVPAGTFVDTRTEPSYLRVCRTLPEFQEQLRDCDLIVAFGAVLSLYHRLLTELNKPIVVDIYSPFLLEGLQRDANLPEFERLVSNENYLRSLQLQLRLGDFFICASEKQRDYWLGMLSGLGRLNPYTYGDDPTLRRLIDVVPFGLPATPPEHSEIVLKGVYKAIAPDDKVILWGGGLWNWFDAPSLIKAMPLILTKRPDVKLFFMGIKRPNPTMPKMKAIDEAVSLAKQLGLYDKSVFFNDWVPYDSRQNYLIEADLSVSLHLDHVETRFSFRTRLLDCLWANLPVVSTRGDSLGEYLAKHGLAFLVEPEDVPGIAQTILKLLDKPNLRADLAPRFQALAQEYQWETVLAPLTNFCRAPYFAPDKIYQQEAISGDGGPQTSIWQKGRRAFQLGGVSTLWRQGVQYLRWRFTRQQNL